MFLAKVSVPYNVTHGNANSYGINSKVEFRRDKEKLDSLKHITNFLKKKNMSSGLHTT